MEKGKKKKPEESKSIVYDNIRTAILVDGGFYKKRAHTCLGEVTPKERADELDKYCRRHLAETINGVVHEHQLYRIFYYDCPPVSKAIYDPLRQKNIEFSKSDTYKWTIEFFEELKKKRKFALRLGELADADQGFYIPPNLTKELFSGKKQLSDIQFSDLRLMMHQKGVDMKIGVDIASLAYKNEVDQIVLISGDSDFVPAAKLARREGIDFVLDSLGAKIKPDLFEHIDGLNIRDNTFKSNFK